MYELVFTFLIVTKAGLPGFHMERMGQFRELEECEKSRGAMMAYQEQLVSERRMFPGVFECKKIQR